MSVKVCFANCVGGATLTSPTCVTFPGEGNVSCPISFDANGDSFFAIEIMEIDKKCSLLFRIIPEGGVFGEDATVGFARQSYAYCGDRYQHLVANGDFVGPEEELPDFTPGCIVGCSVSSGNVSFYINNEIVGKLSAGVRGRI